MIKILSSLHYTDIIKAHFKGETEKLKKKAEIDLRMTQVLSAIDLILIKKEKKTEN